MSIKLIVSDIDYTLIDGPTLPTSRVIQVLRRAMQRGISVAVATGRGLFEARHIAQCIGGIRYCICMTGAELYDLQEERSIFCRTIPNKLLKRVVEAAEQFPGVYCQLYCENEIVADKQAMEAIRENETAMRYLDTVKDRLIVAEDIAKAVEERALKGAKFLIIAKKQEQLAPLKAEILKTPGLSAVFSGSWSVEVMDASVTKGTALRELREKLGVRKEEVLAIGDSENDVAMLEEAGIGVAMGNATAPLLKCAKHIVPPVWEDGVAVAVEKFALGRE